LGDLAASAKAEALPTRSWPLSIAYGRPKVNDKGQVPSRISETRQGAIITSELINRTVLPLPLAIPTSDDFFGGDPIDKASYRSID